MNVIVENAPAATVRFAEGIADALGFGWRIDGAFGNASRVVHSDGRILHVVLRETLMHVEIRGIRPTGSTAPERSVTLDARLGPGPTVDMLRSKLLGQYTDEFDVAISRLEQRTANSYARRAAAVRLAGLIPGDDAEPDGTYIRWRDREHGHGRVTVDSGGTVTLEIRDLPVAAAEAALRAIAAAGSH